MPRAQFDAESQEIMDRPGWSGARALGAIVIPLPFAALAVFLGTHVLRDYGWTLFVGFPFVLPLLSVLIYGHGRGASIGECLKLGGLWVAVTVGVMTITAFEGIICIVMLLPLAAQVVLLGCVAGYAVLRLTGRRPDDLGKVALLLAALLPAMLGAEHWADLRPIQFTCETSVVVDAPPETVWRHVVRFADLPEPDEWYFRLGLAYPIRARIEGTGVGAIRRCEFSTGAFVEPIEAWDEPNLLRFSVTDNPAPMREWNPLFDIHPPHLDGFLVSRRGQFHLTRLPGGKTLLRGSTLYQHGLWPAAYWRLWSDPIIHRIHDRVLKHIKSLAEATEAGTTQP